MYLVNKLENCRYMQYLAVVCAALSAFCSNTIGSWSSPSIVKLMSSNSPIGVTLDNNQASWVASMPLLGAMIGSCTSFIFLNTFGSKWCVLFSAVPLTASWLGIAFTRSAVILIVMRFISGIADGFILTSLPLYIGEVADKDIRGKLAGINPILGCLGNLCILSIGPFASYKVLTLMCAVFPIIFGVTFFFLPQSPYFLLRRRKVDECKRCLRSLLSKNTNEIVLHQYLNEVEATIKTSLQNKYNILYIFTKKNFLIAVFVTLSLGFIAAFSGMTAVKSYLQTIIGLTTSSISPQNSSIIFGVVQLPPVILAALLADKVGRKMLLTISTLGCAISLTTEGVYFYLQEVTKIDLSGASWLPTVCLAIYLVMLPFGITSVKSIIASEIYADDIKGFAVAINATFTNCFFFLSIMYFLPISDAWGMHVMFWIFSVICFYGTIFAIFILPETKGKSFLEIQEILKAKQCC